MIKKATIGAGCFWCIEACFKEVHGVKSVLPGYSGGDASTANYKTVCSGSTKHAEVAHIEFDDQEISFERILELFWFIHDPTQLNRQGNDIGAQYRSVIFTHDDDQRKTAELYKERLEKNKVWDNPIVTEIVDFKAFYPAEDYHVNYLENNPENPYCQSVVRPKVDKFREVFKDLLK